MKEEKFTHCEKSYKAIEEFRKSADSIALFVEECNIEKDLVNKIAVKDLYKDYKIFCSDDNFRPVAKTKFGKHLENLGFERTRLNNGNSAFYINRPKKLFSFSSSEDSASSENDLNLNTLNFLKINKNNNFNTEE